MALLGLVVGVEHVMELGRRAVLENTMMSGLYSEERVPDDPCPKTI